jgi:hypothetical protein
LVVSLALFVPFISNFEVALEGFMLVESRLTLVTLSNIVSNLLVLLLHVRYKPVDHSADSEVVSRNL